MPSPRVLLLYNEPTLPADHPDADSEHDILYTADTVGRILQQAGLAVARLGVTADPAALLAGVKAAAPDVVFNLYEGTAGWGHDEAFVAGILELLRLPYTGSPPQPLTLCRSKPLTKRLLAGAGLPTAGFFVVDGDEPVPPCPLPWPVIVKPGLEDASVGIDQNSVVTSQDQLEARVAYIRERYGPAVLVEQFVRGREFNVALVERDGRPETLPFSEILFVPPDDRPELWPIVSFDAKWRPGTVDFVATPAKNPADVTPDLHAAVSGLAKKAFALAGCRDYARVDFRVDEAGRPFVLEVNPNPCISPLAGLAAGLESARVPYPDFILGLVRAAVGRGAAGLPVGSPEPGVSDLALETARPATPKFRVRPARRGDLPALSRLADAADGWAADDRKRLAGRIEELIARKNRGGWRCLVLAGRGVVAGVACVAPADEPHGVWELEYLAVAPSARRAGWGRTLLAAAEAEAAAAGGRVLTAALSSAAGFAAARQFLARVGYLPAGEVPEFYRDGYSRLTYAKPLPAADPARAEAAAESGPTAG